MTMPNVGAITARVVGFLEEQPGVKSSTRLLALIFAILAAVVVVVLMGGYTLWQLIHGKPVDPLVITAFIGALCPLVYQGAVAITRRTATPPGAPGDNS